MSSSDYTRFKRTGVILKNLAKESYVLDDSEYTDLMDYNLENTITNSKIIYNRLIPPNRQNVYNMELNVSSCPNFTLCTQTQNRPNRKKLLSCQIAPRPRSKYIKDRMYFSKQYKTLCLDKAGNQTKCKSCSNALCCGCAPSSTTKSTGCKSFTF